MTDIRREIDPEQPRLSDPAAFKIARIGFDLAVFALGYAAELEQALEQSYAETDNALAMAERDPLTGLPNRLHWNRFMAKTDDSIRESDHNFCLAALDLDHFKEVNDTKGHEAGDKLLIAFANTLMKRSRQDDLVARIGGEEFVWKLTGATPEEALGVLQGLHFQFSGEFGHTFSGGIVQHRAGQPVRKTLNQADETMYIAKREGRSQTLIG